MSLVPFTVTFITELGPTNTFYFRAPNIFLNWVFARRACFRISLYPCSTALFIIYQFHPLGNILTGSRMVWLFLTEKTIKLTTLTLNTNLAIILSPFTE